MLLSASAITLSAPAASAAPAIQTIRNYDHSGTACASINTTRGTSGYYKTQSPNSVTGMAFNGTDLLYSCWGDGTITAIRPTANATTYQKDSSVGAGGIYTVTGLPGAGTPGIGSLDWDAQHNVLWACNLSAFTGLQKKLGADVGYITLSTDGSGNATFTHVANAPDGCVNGIDYNPADSTVSVAGVTLNDSTKTIDQFVINSDLSAGAMTTWQPGKPLTPDGYVSGIEYGANGLFLADNHSSTKTLQYTTDFVTSTRLSSSSHRYEDVACDPVTFAPTVVVWVEWFDHNQAEPFQVPNNDSCTATTPPPPPLSVTQDPPAPVTADAALSYTVHVTNNGSAGQTSVVLSDTPPANTIFGSATPTQGSCSTTLPLTCALGSMAGTSSASVTVTVTPIKPGTYTNTASAASDQATSQPSSKDASVTAETNVSYVSVDDGGLSSASPAPSQGSIVQFDFLGSAGHELTDSIGLFDSGVQTPISYYRQELDAAAAYKITDNPSGHATTINISPTVVGPGPYTTSGFVIAWSSQPLPAGYDEDIQVQLPGSTTWTTWLMNQTGASATYTPANGTGTYKFRARLQKTGSTATAYSTAFKVSVTA
jgi:uncharacterized repeat protein (TIGR01451 family)